MRRFSPSWKVATFLGLVALAMAITLNVTDTDTAEFKNPFLIIGIICIIFALLVLLREYDSTRPRYR